MIETMLPWEQEVDDHRKKARIKYNYYLKGRIGWQGLKAEEFIEAGPFLVTGTDFNNGKVNWDTCYHISEERYAEAPEIHVQRGDLLVTKDGTIGKTAYIEDKPEKVSLNSHLLLMRPINKLYSNRFLFWIINSHIFENYYNYTQTGTIMASLSQEKINNFAYYMPDIEEQEKISNYLDDRCSKIDEIIAEATASIEEYKELKQAVIFEAVTKGLDKNVPMKDSRIKGIGVIPCHWMVKRVKNILFEVTDRTIDGHEEPLSVTQQYGIVKSSDIQVANPSSTYENYRLVSIGDIVFNKYKAHSGVFFASPYNGIVTFNYSVYRCFEDNIPKYYELLFHTQACIDEFKRQMHGVGESISPLYTRDLMRIFIIEPPKNEQRKIIKYLETEIEKYDSLISEKQSLIEDLQAYKKSLIYEVVTGKRRVV